MTGPVLECTSIIQSQNKYPYHASSGASTSGFVKRLRHCSRVKCPALAVSLREPGSSSYSSSLELTRTYSFRRSLFFHTSSRIVSSGRSNNGSSAEEEKQHWCVRLYFLVSISLLSIHSKTANSLSRYNIVISCKKATYILKCCSRVTVNQHLSDSFNKTEH